MTEKYYKSVLDTYTKFESRHIAYVHGLGEEMEADVHKKLFLDAANLVDQAEVAYADYQDRQESQAVEATRAAQAAEKKEKMTSQKKVDLKKYDTEKAVFLNYLHAQVRDVEDVSVDVNAETLKRELPDIQRKYEDVIKLYEKLLEVVDTAEYDGLFNGRMDFESDYKKNLFTLKTYVTNNCTSDPSVSSRSSSPSARTDLFKLKKMDLPVFNGDVRTYPAFKRDFNKMVVSPGLHDKDSMAYLIRNQCLSDKIQRFVRNMEDYDEIWKVLDDKFDDKSEVIDQIHKQINSLKCLEDGDYAGVINLVDVLEQAKLDLQATGGVNSLNNATTVRQILSKCSRSLREELTRELNGVEPDSEFDMIMKTLIDRRRDAQRLVRVAADGRPKLPQKVKGSANAASGNTVKTDGKKTPWTCPTTGCTYRQRHFLSECRAFKKLKVDDKGVIIRDKDLCVLCFGLHKVDKCPKKTSGWKVCDVNNCNKWHSRLLHGATTPGLVLATWSTDFSSSMGRKTILLIQQIPTAHGEDVLTLWDPGSSTSLVTFDYAERAGLHGVPCQFELTGVGKKTTTYSTRLYAVSLVDVRGEIRKVQAFGIDEIMTDAEEIRESEAAKLFGVEPDKLKRPAGRVNLLVGVSEVDLLPVRVKVADKLAVFASQFGSGLVLGGSCQSENEELSVLAEQAAHAKTRVVRTIDFLSAEAHGTDVPKRCRSCRGCKECGTKAGQLTWTEAMELSQIELGLSLDVDAKRWTVSYPYKVDPDILSDNYSQAYACMVSIEKRLRKTGNLEAFNEQFRDCVQRKVFEKVSAEELEKYEGPVNYATITEAFKEGDGVTTPLRLCTNSSMKFRGVSLNDILMKGPSSLNDIYSVMLNFRSYQCAFLKDVSKFYNSILISERDSHLSRLLWRWGEQEKEPTTFKSNTVNFGVKPAGGIALSSLRQTAELYKSIDEEAADKLKNDNYVDDVASGGKDKKRAIEISQNMDKIVAQGGFKFKKTIMSGDDVDPVKVLGTHWDVRQDKLHLEIKVNVSRKYKGTKVEADLNLENIREDFPDELTKRVVWRVVLGQFDLLGLACVFLVRLKLLMRDLSGEEERSIGWDEPVKNEVKERFLCLLGMLGKVKQLRFPRCFVPEFADPDFQPQLLCFGDGSKQAFCGLVYVRWRLLDGTFKCLLVTGKTRVAPIKKISLPRIELLGAVTTVRLAVSVQEAVKFQFGRRFFFTDSTAVYGMIQGDCGSFEEFVGVRVGEIKFKTKPDSEWFWIPSKQNLADLGTRDDVSPEILDEKSVYQCGLEWMSESEEKWPINQSKGEVPKEELIPAARCMVATAEDTDTLIRLEKYTSVEKPKRILAIVLLFLTNAKTQGLKALKNKKEIVGKTDDFYETAENILLLVLKLK